MKNDDTFANDAEFFKTWFKDFVQGNFGLATTYWIGWILAGNLFWIFARYIAFEPTAYTYIKVIVLTLVMSYTVASLTALWRASNKYKGRKLWADLAKGVVAINVFFGLLFIFGNFS